MLTANSYSEWFRNPENFSNEVKAWHSVGFQYTYAAHIALWCSKYPIKRILELGCGIGLVPINLVPGIQYLGIDQSEEAIELATSSNSKSIEFRVRDIRNLDSLEWVPDLVCSFAVLKHFSLEEWDSVFSSMLVRGDFGLFTMSIAEEDTDDGILVHHSWITRERLSSLLKKSGYEMLYRTVI